jgi:dTDP-4-amino-4,6-dideoxygalactose transaminase
MPVPFLELARQHEELATEITAALAAVGRRGNYILGPEVASFEAEWASYCGVSGAVGVGNGTDALTLALIASGVIHPHQGDEVITTPLTSPYTALAIHNAGAIPVFADIDPVTLTLDPRAIEATITRHTRAIVPVHLYGQMASMETINELAGRHQLFVLEDAAQAHGARANGRSAGSLGHAGAFSFYPTKNLGANGDGGAVVSNDAELTERVKLLRQGGHPAAVQNELDGRNSRLDEMQAAILRLKLRRLDVWTARRQAIAEQYHTAFRESPRLQLPWAPEAAAHVYHLYVVQHPERDRLREYLAANGVETMIHYPFLLHRLRLFQCSEQRALPAAESVADRILSLPLYPQMTTPEVARVIEAVRGFESGDL